MSERLKLTTYFGERDRSGDRFLADAIFDAHTEDGVGFSILLRGAQGFGLTHHLRTDRRLTLSEDLPLVSIAVDDAERIEAVRAAQQDMMSSGLMTIERVDVLRGPPPESSKLTIQLGRREQAGGRSAFLAACALLHERGVAGATALLGVDGMLRGHRERARFVGRNANVPMMVVAVGDGDVLGGVVPELRNLLADPLLTVERVRICRRDGERLAGTELRTPRNAPWRKLQVYTSESALHEGRPIHIEAIRRLRQSGARGATALRGVWGFHGGHDPHGDRLLQLRRRVPMVTTVIDTADRIDEWFAVVDELTSETGLVTIEAVPAAIAFSGEHRVGESKLGPHSPDGRRER